MKYLVILILPFLLQSCLVKAIEGGGPTRLQWINNSTQEICSFSINYGSSDSLLTYPLHLQSQEKSAPITINSWGRFPLSIQSCTGTTYNLGSQDLNGGSMQWTLTNQGDSLSLSSRQVDQSWF